MVYFLPYAHPCCFSWELTAQACKTLQESLQTRKAVLGSVLLPCIAKLFYTWALVEKVSTGTRVPHPPVNGAYAILPVTTPFRFGIHRGNAVTFAPKIREDY